MRKRFLVSAIAAVAMTVGSGVSAFAASVPPPTDPDCHGDIMVFERHDTGMSIGQASVQKTGNGSLVHVFQSHIKTYCKSA